MSWRIAVAELQPRFSPLIASLSLPESPTRFQLPARSCYQCTFSPAHRAAKAFYQAFCDSLSGSVRAGYSAQTVEWRSVLPCKIDTMLWHPMPQIADMLISLVNTNLEVAVAAMASETIVGPLGRQKPNRRAVCFVPVGKLRVVWLEELSEDGPSIFALFAADQSTDMSCAIAEKVEEDDIPAVFRIKAAEQHAFQSPGMWIRARGVAWRKPVDKAGGCLGRSFPECSGEFNQNL